MEDHAMRHTLDLQASAARNLSLAFLFLIAPLAEAGVIMPEHIRIDINSTPGHINYAFEMEYDTGDPDMAVDVLFLGIFFATYASERDEPWLSAAYIENFPETSHDLNGTLRRFLFEKEYGGQRYDFMNRVSLEDTYVFAFASEVYYTPTNCTPFADDCPPALAVSGYGETLITFYDGQDGTDNPGPGNPVDVPIPGSLPLGMIAALGIFLRSRSSGAGRQ
ncbi:MAG: hypothetical protein CME36_10080 [unclassified Hahellaceae]|nr:hypothetical protein [Hahellaceae bacterium]|tara:strand:- start:10297 stop:10959 length:663 start_codon:yes stop_codon:yes gene_type:complete